MIVLCVPQTRPTGELIAAKLKELLNGDCSVDTWNPRHTEESCVVRWGNSSPGACMVGANAKVFNKPASISLSANKLQSLIAMRDAGVSVPQFASDRSEVNFDGPWVARPHHHMCGQYFLKVKHQRNIPSGRLVMKYIKKHDEWRVFVLFGKVWRVGKRVPKTDETPHDFIWSLSKGWKIELVEEHPDCIATEAVKAVTSVGLDFGAVDVCVDHFGKPWVFEVNSAPGLSEYKIDRLSKRIVKWTLAGSR